MFQRPLSINHVELAYRPGEKDVARAVYELLGFYVEEGRTVLFEGRPKSWLFASIDPENANGADNVIYSSEMAPEQERYEAVLAAAADGDDTVQEAFGAYQRQRAVNPQMFPHFGISVPTLDDWAARVARVREAASNDPILAGRIKIVSTIKPGDPNAFTGQTQAFVETDVLALGLFVHTPLVFELQYTPQESLDYYQRYTPAGQSDQVTG